MSPDPPRQRAFRWLHPGRFYLEWLLVGIAASILAVGVARTPLGNPIDRALYDQLIRLSPRRPSDRILIVAIDDASLAERGAWPWPRTAHAALLDRLTASGAAAVALDLLLLEPDPHGQAEGGDAALAAALSRSGRTILPVLQLSPGENGRAVRTVLPIPPLAAAVAALGQVNIAPDTDGVVRRVSARVADQGVCWPQLSLAALRIADAAGPDRQCRDLAAASTRTSSLIGARPELIPFAGRPGRFRTVSAAAVMRGEVPPEFVRGRIVLVGVTAAGLGDRYPTASSSRNGGLTGVELQANLLDAAITGARLRLASPLPVGGLAVTEVWLLLFWLTRLRPRAGLWVLVGFAAAALAGAIVAFGFGWWTSPLPALVGLIVAYPLWSWRRLALTSDALGREIARFEADAALEPFPIRPTRPDRIKRALSRYLGAFSNDEPVSTSPENALVAAGADPLDRQMDTLSHAAERLRALHRMLAETLQSLPDATVAVDAQGVIRLANGRASARADGMALAGVGLQAWLVAALGPRAGRETHAALAAGAMTVEATAADGADFEVGAADVRGLAPDGPWRIVRLADVTPIRRAVRQREDALQLLTHDIRAPFASISALAAEPGPAPSILARIDAYARRGRTLAESYVQWSRAENAEVAEEPFDLRDALIDAADELWSIARQSGVELRSDYPEDELLVRGDRGLVTRAVINLIDNAVRHSPQDGIVEAVCFIKGDWAVCEVRDRGPGVDPAVEARLFQRFVRSNREGATTGAGLGLAIAALAVQRIGGAATYDPRPGGGAIFRLSAPLFRES